MNPASLILLVFIAPCSLVVLCGWLHGKGKAEYLCWTCGAAFFAYPGQVLICPECFTEAKVVDW